MENSKEKALIPQFSDFFLDFHPSKSVSEVLVYPLYHICLVFNDNSIEFWSLNPNPKRISELLIDFEYFCYTKQGENFLIFLTKKPEIKVLDLKTLKFTYFSKEFTEDLLSDSDFPNKKHINQTTNLFQIIFLEKTQTLAIIYRKGFMENSMTYILYLIKIQVSENFLIKVPYSSPISLFLKIFNLDNEKFLLFDLQHESQKNPLLILWAYDDNVYHETQIILNKWFSGVLVDVTMSLDKKAIKFFGNMNGVKNPYTFEAILETGELKIVRNFCDTLENWLFMSHITTNFKKKLMVCEGQDFENLGSFLKIDGPVKNFLMLIDGEERWGGSYEGESIVGFLEFAEGRGLVRTLSFIERKMGILYILEKKGIKERFGRFILREIMDFF